MNIRNVNLSLIFLWNYSYFKFNAGNIYSFICFIYRLYHRSVPGSSHPGRGGARGSAGWGGRVVTVQS